MFKLKVLENKAGVVKQHDTVAEVTTLKTRECVKIQKSKGNLFKSLGLVACTAAILVILSNYSYGQELRQVKGLNGKWGFVDGAGREVISFKYEEAQEFSEGLARVKFNKKWGFIDKNGMVIIPCEYEDAGDFSEGLARVCEDMRSTWEQPAFFKWGFIDKYGKKIIPCIYEDAGDFSEGLARVKYGGKWGFINNTSTSVISFIYNEASDFSKGYARVRIKRNWGFIDKIGREVFKNVSGETINKTNETQAQEKPEQKVVNTTTEPQPQKTADPQKTSELQTTSTYDVILLNDGQEIKAKVTEITPYEIKYKAVENLDGPTRTLDKSDVFLINYANGTREVIGTPSKATASQTRGESNRSYTTESSFQGIALGVNALIGFTFISEDLVDGGLGAKISYTFNLPIRVVGEFDILWTKKSVYGVVAHSRWIGFDVYAQYLFFGKNKNFATYPLYGFGGTNYKETIKYESETMSESTNYPINTFGWGVEGYHGQFTYGTEMRFKLVTKNGNYAGYRFHFVAGIGYKF